MKLRIQLWWIAPLAAFLLGCILIPLAGLESDESVFGLATFGGLDREFCMNIFGHRLPLMIYYYAGSLKGLLYWPLLHVFAPSLWSIRLPVVLTGAISVVLLYDFARRVANPMAATIAALLLATDPCFIISNTFDWGPVALEHVLLLLGLALFARGRGKLACFVFGLALWNKAVFGWALAGLIAGCTVVYWPVVRSALNNRRRVAGCLISFLLGCSPLLIYNIRHPASTARANVHLSFEGIHDKLTSLRYTLDGSDLFGVVAGMDGVTDSSGLRFHNLFLPALLIAIALSAWRIRSPEFKGARFALVFCITSFLLIALTRYAGSAHHIVLLYPMPQLIVAVALACLPAKRITVVLATLLIASNLLVFSTYITQLRRSGPVGLFTDATGPLSNSFQDGADRVFPIDYGFEENVWLLHNGKLYMRFLQPADDTRIALEDPRAIFVDHLAGHEYFPGAGERIDNAARLLGLHRTPLRTITDLKGRPQMVVFRYGPD